MHSLQSRLSLGLLVSLVIAFVVQWTVANRALEYLLEQQAIDHLEQETETILGLARVSEAGEPVIDTGRVDARFSRPFSGHYFLIRIGTHTARSRSLWDAALEIPDVATGQVVHRHVPGPEGQRLLLVAHGFVKSERSIVVAAAEDTTALRARIREFQWQYAILSVTMLLILVALHVAWVRRGLRPLTIIETELRSLEQGQRPRLSEERVPREVQPLVRQFNRLIGLLLTRMERSRNALGNLAHALKTPLTALQQQLDRPELNAHPDLQQQLRRHTTMLRELAERELKRARIAGGALPAQRYDLAATVDDLVQTLRMAYRDKAPEFEIKIADGVSPLDREDLLELLGNLLDNACKWARRRVALTIRAGERWSFEVEDDGPGVAPEKIELITQRGIRIDENTAGHGLGLAIVKDLVENYGGQLSFGVSTRLGGFRACAEIPAN